MTRHLNLTPRPPQPASPPLVAVDRAIAELRRGGSVVITGDDLCVLALAAEGASEAMLLQLAAASGALPALIMTGRRAVVLGLRPVTESGSVIRVTALGGVAAADVAWLADPCDSAPAPSTDWATEDLADDSLSAAAVALAKLARLLPAVVVVDYSACGASDLVTVPAADIVSYQQIAARTLRLVSEARVPLKDAENARIVAFRPSDGGIEHLAIVIGEPDPDQPVLTRLHSECFTGDLLGSLRCDCGDQLRGAIAEIAQAGSGVLLYLSQEGRGIGLVNKLRAYRLQDEGFDTLDANLQLGFDDDERLYAPAAEMLRLLGISQVRLLTNNPAKVEALGRHGVEVAERVPHVFPANDHNEFYLRTKAARGGHLF